MGSTHFSREEKEKQNFSGFIVRQDNIKSIKRAESFLANRATKTPKAVIQTNIICFN